MILDHLQRIMDLLQKHDAQNLVWKFERLKAHYEEIFEKKDINEKEGNELFDDILTSPELNDTSCPLKAEFGNAVKKFVRLIRETYNEVVGQVKVVEIAGNLGDVETLANFAEKFIKDHPEITNHPGFEKVKNFIEEYKKSKNV